MKQSIESIQSPHQSSRGTHIPRLIVCHIADGTYEGTKAWFQNPESLTSSHYIVAEDGRICQCVPLDRMAWCNGTNIHVGSSQFFGHSTLPLVKELGGNANQYSVSIECEGYGAKTNGSLTQPQLSSLAALIQDIQTQVQNEYGFLIPSNRDHIVGHFEINPKTKPHCPGKLFPWKGLMERLAGLEELPAKESKQYKVLEQHGSYSSLARAKAHLEQIKAQGGYAWIAEE